MTRPVRIFPLVAHRAALALAGAALALSTAARAQVDPSKPVFTAPLVHPIGAPDAAPDPAQDAVAAALAAAQAAPPSAGRQRAAPARARSPRAHAEEVADAFQSACVRGHGSPDVAIDWALENGFMPLPEADRVQAPQLTEQGEPASVFARDEAEPLMLVAGGKPAVCAVMTQRSVDGQRLRARMEGFVATWLGRKAAPKPVVSMDTGAQPTRMEGYKFAQDERTHTLIVIAPLTSGRGVSFLSHSVDDAAPAR